jgi:uncharacterized protein
MTINNDMQYFVLSARMRAIYLILIIVCLVFNGCAAFSNLGSNSTAQSSIDESSPVSIMIRFYQGPMDHFSPVRFGECPMYPHCSEYALDAIQTHGVIIGWFMTCDRLMRCGRDEINLSPEIIVDGKGKTFDPVDRNDIWLQNHLLNP